MSDENTNKKSQNISDKIYNLLEESYQTGKVKKGTNEVTKAIERGTAKFVVVAEDVDPTSIVAHIPVLCEQKKIIFSNVPSKKELGGTVGLKVGCASVAVINEGEAKSQLVEIIKALSVKTV